MLLSQDSNRSYLHFIHYIYRKKKNLEARGNLIERLTESNFLNHAFGFRNKN
jgi:hypothetical protein